MRSQYVAGCLAAVYPGAIGMSIVILSEAIFCPLMLLMLLAWQRALLAQRARDVVGSSLLAGAVAALGILARPSLLLFMPMASILILVLHRRRIVQAQIITLIAMACMLTMSPWWIRNALITHRFVPTTLQVGASLYDGLHETATGGSDENMEFVNAFIAEQRSEDAQLSQNGQLDVSKASTFEYRLNKRMQSAAMRWASENISGAIRLALVKFARTWSVWPAAGEVGSTGLRLVLTLGCFSILLLAAVSAWRLHRDSRNESGWAIALCWMPAIYFTLLHMVFVGSIRYREPAVLVLVALAGCALIRWNESRTGQGSQSIEPSESRNSA